MERYIGLTGQEAERRRRAGEGNTQALPPTKSVRTILRENILTPFNLLNLLLAGLVIGVGSWKNVLFLGVVFWNCVIGVVQELRSKAAIDRLTLIAAPHAKVLRDGEVCQLPLDELVRGDVVKLEAGDQVGVDCVILAGRCQMDESLLTGESEPVDRGEGETLLSGSFLAAGHCLAQVVHVGGENYAAQIAAGAKYVTRPNSQILQTVNKIIRGVGFALAPLGVALFFKQLVFTAATAEEAVVSTVAALVGMIPEGLVLLTSVVLAVSVIRLSRRGALAQELYSIEMLARVDVLCLDKTGTLTTGELTVGQPVLAPGRREEELRPALAALLAATGDTNPTARALRAWAGEAGAWEPTRAVPFRADRKWSGACSPTGESWVLGAAQFLFPQGLGELEPELERLVGQGERVVVLGVAQAPFGAGGALPKGLRPVALLPLGDTLRPWAAETLAYFRDQGVELKLLSGDDPRTVANLAAQAGLEGAERWVDAAELAGEAEVRAAAERYTVFGRVTPQQKLWLVQELKAGGHTVAMTGDGVNDVLALRESDCGVAMASGSEAARNVSQIVLMDSDFSAMPAIVGEGRRAINNLQRSAALFLTKTCFSVTLAVCFLFLGVPYPFQPIQLTLINALTIGAPSFLLALEPNLERVRGRFQDNVFSRAVPGAASMVTGVLFSVALVPWLGLTRGELSTLCVLAVGFGGLVNLYFISAPLDLARGALLGAMTAGFYLAAWAFGGFFSLVPLRGWMWAALGALMLWTVLVQAGARAALRRYGRRDAGPPG